MAYGLRLNWLRLARHALLSPCLFLGCQTWVAAQAAATPAPTAEQLLQARTASATMLKQWASAHFAVPEALKLEAGLQRAAAALAAAHLERLNTRLGAWIDDELAHAPDVDDLWKRVLARFVNELVLWQLDTTGEAYDLAIKRALDDPALCAMQGWDTRLPFHKLLSTLQRLGAADRDTVLASQAQMLARWGAPRALPERPVPGLREQALAAAHLLQGDERSAVEPPLSPRLAWVLLTQGQRPTAGADLCALVQWASRRADMGAAAVPELMHRVRYALLEDVAMVLHRRGDVVAAPGEYPTAARRLNVEGTVTVQGRTRDGAPGLADARIVAREIVVPGIRGVRPVAFEVIFDEATLERLKAVQPKAAAPDSVVRLSFVWRLE